MPEADFSDSIDRTVVRIAPIDEVQSDFAFWKTQPYQRRIATVEDIRREYHGWAPGAHPDFRAFVRLLNEKDVRYLIVGGSAVAFHGHPRYTKDLDLWIDRNPENAGRLIHALDAFGFGAVGLSDDDSLKPGRIIQLGRPPHRIDILTELRGVRFPDAFEGRITADIDGVPFQFIALEDLKRNKRAVGRHQDLADLENLE